MPITFERPTVLIGLGGTGKQTLLYLRRMFFERYGVKTLPHVAQVVIDTDGRKQNLDDSAYDEFAREVTFDDELVVTPLNQILRNYHANRAQYPHIDSWLDRSLEAHGEISDGASQIRSFGRLAFFHHYAKIRNRLQQAYTAVTNFAALEHSLKRFNMQMDPDAGGVETWIVFSVAGGTGSGMFLDTAFLAKRLAAPFGGGEARSVILLPSAFASNPPEHQSSHSDHRVFANAYAALTELETYNYQRSQEGDARNTSLFPIQWTADLFSQGATERGPVFSTSWLVDNEPRDGGGMVHGERMALCQMIAEWLYIQFGAATPELAGALRSNRSNDANDFVPSAEVSISHANTNGGHTEHPVKLLYSRRYSSFGLSKIYVPTSNLANQAYAKLVGDLARRWLAEDAVGDIRGAGLNQLNPAIYLPNDVTQDGHVSALAKRLSLAGSNSLSRRFKTLIQDRLDRLRAAGFEQGAEAEARDWFNLEIMQGLLDGSSTSHLRRGEITKYIQNDNIPAATGEILAALDAYVAKSTATPGERMKFADESLKQVADDFTKAASQAETAAAKHAKLGRKRQSELEQLLVWAQSHRGFDRRILFEVAFKKMAERADAEFKQQVMLGVSTVAREIAKTIGVGRTVKDADGVEKTVVSGMRLDIVTLKIVIEKLERRSKERITALRQAPTSPLNYRAPTVDPAGDLTGDAELEALYKDRDGKLIGAEQLDRIEEQLFVELGSKGLGSPWLLKDRADANGIEETFEELLEFASRRLSHLPSLTEDAVLRFDQKFRHTGGAEQYEAELSRVFARGSPWLPRPTHNLGGHETYRDLGFSRYVACASEAARGPRKALLERVGAGAQVVHGPLDAVYFESELAGTPLFAVRHIDLYRNAYLGHLNAADPATRVVHTELFLEKFVDLVPYTAEELQRRLRAIKTFVRAMVSGVMQPDSEGRTGSAEWMFYERNRVSPRPVRKRLGSYITAIRSLSSPDSATHRALAAEVDNQYSTRVTQDDIGRLYFAVNEMKAEPPIEGNEWQAAVESMLNGMRERYTDGIIRQATDCGSSFAAWGEAVPNGPGRPFWRVRSLAAAR